MSSPTPTATYGPGGRAASDLRYVLRWPLGDGPTIAWIGLNPSTATELALDPTLRRVCSYSAAWGFGAVVMLNLWPLRATRPRDLWAWLDDDRSLIQDTNDAHLRGETAEAGLVVLAWGAGPGALAKARQALAAREARVLQRLKDRPLAYLRKTAGGHPAHPLYLPKGLRPLDWDTGEPLRRFT